MLEVSFNTNKEFSSSIYNSVKDENENDFKTLLESKDYDAILEDSLKNLSEFEKEVHLEVLKNLQEEGYSKNSLINLNLYLISKKQNPLEELNLSKEDKELLDTYNSMFENIKRVLEEKKEEKLALKPLEAKMFKDDTLLKTKDFLDGKVIQKHSLNIEV